MTDVSGVRKKSMQSSTYKGKASVLIPSFHREESSQLWIHYLCRLATMQMLFSHLVPVFGCLTGREGEDVPGGHGVPG